MADQKDTVRLFVRDMARLRAAVEALLTAEPNATVIESWSVKDLLAHIAAWDRELVRAVNEVLAGKAPSFVSGSTDEFNERAVNRSRDLPLDGVRAEAEAAHRDLLRAIEGLRPDLWAADSGRRWRDGTAITPVSLFAYEYKNQTHYAGHASEIEGILARWISPGSPDSSD